MANSKPMKSGILRIEKLLLDYAHSRKWKKNGARVYFRVNEDWGRIVIVFVGPFSDDEDKRDHEWEKIYEFLEKNLADDSILFHSINLVLRTPEEVSQGGVYSIDSDFVEAHDI